MPWHVWNFLKYLFLKEMPFVDLHQTVFFVKCKLTAAICVDKA